MENDMIKDNKNQLKNEIKNEIIKNINDILAVNKIPKINNLTVMNLNKQTAYIGNIDILDYDLIETIEKQLNELFEKYGTYSVKNKEIVSCCAPSYKKISFKVNVNIE